MKTTATELRATLYASLDRVALTGEEIELERKGVRLRIVRDSSSSRLAGLPRRDTMLADPERIVDTGWADAWTAEGP
jgi:hypothetical protein